MSIKLRTASDGLVVLQPEDTASEVTVTVPAGTDTLLNTSSDIEAQVKTATNATGDAPIYACRAWVNFAQRSVAPTHTGIRGSGNVSSYTRTSEGNYTVNFATAMPDANYSVVDGGTRDGGIANAYKIMTDTFTTSSFRVRTGTDIVNTAADHFIISLAVFR